MNSFLKTMLICLLASTTFFAYAQTEYLYEPSPKAPFGLPNPKAPKEIMDFAPLIGECDCKSVSRIDKNTWADTVKMVWRFKYIMNGLAIQDETIKEDGNHSGSIRQFIADSARWYVHYYSSKAPTTVLPAWEGGLSEEGKIILYKDSPAPNGIPGNYRLVFSDISEKGFNWEGAWVDKTETFSYPTWKIFCTKKKYAKNEKAKAQIMANIDAFSRAYERGDSEFLANAYTEDGKVFPKNGEITEGRALLKRFWTVKEGSKIVRHQVTPSEITFIGDYAYDYGYYEGESQSKGGEVSGFKGKYVIIWKRIDGQWKIYIDIWNGL